MILKENYCSFDFVLTGRIKRLKVPRSKNTKQEDVQVDFRKLKSHKNGEKPGKQKYFLDSAKQCYKGKFCSGLENAKQKKKSLLIMANRGKSGTSSDYTGYTVLVTYFSKNEGENKKFWKINNHLYGPTAQKEKRGAGSDQLSESNQRELPQWLALC